MVDVVFLAEQARDVAQSILQHLIGAHACIVKPRDMAVTGWLKQATVYCRDWQELNLYVGRLARPIDFLAPVDNRRFQDLVAKRIKVQLRARSRRGRILLVIAD